VIEETIEDNHLTITIITKTVKKGKKEIKNYIFF
jgi:hypothetical protein